TEFPGYILRDFYVIYLHRNRFKNTGLNDGTWESFFFVAPMDFCNGIFKSAEKSPIDPVFTLPQTGRPSYESRTGFGQQLQVMFVAYRIVDRGGITGRVKTMALFRQGLHRNRPAQMPFELIAGHAKPEIRFLLR